MFAPIPAATLIQTLHGTTYRVNPVASKEENEDPERRPSVPQQDSLSLRSISSRDASQQ